MASHVTSRGQQVFNPFLFRIPIGALLKYIGLTIAAIFESLIITVL